MPKITIAYWHGPIDGIKYNHIQADGIFWPI